jgi:hypothetical protein
MLYDNRPVDEIVPLVERSIADGSMYEYDNGLFWVNAHSTLELCDVDVMGHWDTTLRIAREQGSLFRELSTHLWRSYGEWRRGQLLEAEESLRTAIEQMRLWRSDPSVGIPHGQSILVQVLVERGQLAAAREVLAEEAHLRRSGTDGDRLVLEATARLLVEEGRPDEALAELALADHAVPYVVNPAWRGAVVERCRALVAVGRRDDAVAAAETAVARARSFGAPSAIGTSLRALGLAQGSDGEAALREAVDRLSGSFRRLEHAHALADLADVVRGPEATALRQEALALADRCAAGLLGDRLRASLVADGVPAQRRRTTSAGCRSSSARSPASSPRAPTRWPWPRRCTSARRRLSGTSSRCARSWRGSEVEVLRYAAFTRDPAGGNPAGVVLDAHGAPDTAMQRVAAEVGFSETRS